MPDPEQAQPKIEHVGYIGMGIMGAPMAANLLKAGFKLTVWNRTPGKCEPLREQGAAVAASPKAVAEARPQVICLNVTDTPDVEAVLFGEAGVAAGAAQGLIVIDHSTISPTATQDFAKRLAERGVTLLDAPVSGGDTGAQQGTLSIMVGAPAPAPGNEVFEHCLPVFQAVGKAITHVGGPGMGQACKACNQIAVANALMGVCEALRLAEQLGLAPEKMIEVVSAGAGGSWQLANLGPKIAARDFAPGFMVDYVIKDLAIVRETAKQLGLSLDATAMIEQRFRAVRDAGAGREGTQALAKAAG